MLTEIRRTSLLAGLIALALPLLAAAASRESEIKARGVLRVGTTGDYQPFSYRANAASPFIGLDIELAADLAKSLGVRLELVPTTWSSLMSDLGGDRFDIAMGGVSITAERQRTAAFSLAYLRDGKTPIARCADQARFQTLAQIDQPGVRVIVNPGGTNERFARAHLHQATLTVWTDNLTIFDQIVTNQADVMITDAIETRLQQKLRPKLCAIHPDTPFDVTEKAYLLPRDADWKATIDAWLRPLLERREHARRLDKWLEHPWPRAAADAIDLNPLLGLIAERLALMPDVARYKWNQTLPIDDPIREQRILEILKHDAAEMGIPEPWAEHYFRAQFEAGKAVQRELFARWKSEGQKRFDDAPDLATVTRPRLDALTPKILRELAQAWPALSDAKQQDRIARDARSIASDRGANPTAITLATAPLVDGSAVRGAP